MVGASDAHAAAPRDRPVTPRELLATMSRGLGIPPGSQVQKAVGESVAWLDDAEPIDELF